MGSERGPVPPGVTPAPHWRRRHRKRGCDCCAGRRAASAPRGHLLNRVAAKGTEEKGGKQRVWLALRDNTVEVVAAGKKGKETGRGGPRSKG